MGGALRKSGAQRGASRSIVGTVLSGLQRLDRTGPRTKASLEKVQQSLFQAKPTPLACPRQSLRVSIAWLLAVHASFPVPKDSLWERHGAESTTELVYPSLAAAVLARLPLAYG